MATSELGVDAVCKNLTRAAIAHIADWCFVVLRDGRRFTTAACANKNRGPLRDAQRFLDRYPLLPQDVVAKVAIDNQPILMERVTERHLEEAARDPEHLGFLRKLHIHSAMLLPLTGPHARAFGVLGMLSSDARRSFDSNDVETAATVAAQAAAAIAEARARSRERDTTKGLRFIAKVNQLLLETDDVRPAVAGIAETVAAEIADACGVLRLNGDTVRVQLLNHRDPAIDAALEHLRGQRPLRPGVERDLAARLRAHRPIVLDADANARLKAAAWPHLAAEFELLAPVTTAILPLAWGTLTYGALIAYFSKRSFEAARDLPLLEEAAARVSVAIEKAEILQRERRIGATLQKALLPTLIPQPRGIRFDSVYASAAGEGKAGGDWYDAIELDDGSVVISVGDVTGRGVEAAAIMSKMRHAMGMAPMHQHDPARVLDAAEWFLRKRYPDAIVTAFVGVVSPDRRSLRFAGAGHPRPILRRAGALAELGTDGLPLGLRHLAPPEQSHSIDLQDGDVLTLYTDGLTEWSRASDDGDRCLERILHNDVMTVSVHPARIVERSCVPAEAPDDVAILTASIGNQPLWSYDSEDARVAAYARRDFVAFLRERGVDSALLARAELVFGELLGNVVRHAPGPVEIVAFQNGQQLSLHVIDSGQPFELSGRLPDDPLSELGRGLFIVQQLAADVRSEPIGTIGNHIVVTM
ncbi:MAG TPA: SpoIIE family protein phosphatase [Candidatus Tumulicola sp.]